MEVVGVGAVVFHDLKKERVKDVVFEWDEVLSFDGETGPYVQYTHARMASILRKAAEQDLDGDPTGVDWSQLADAAPILLLLGRLPAVIRAAARDAEPSQISQYALELCRTINSWYVDHRVLGDDEATTKARLALVRGAKVVLRNSLALLGVAAPEEM